MSDSNIQVVVPPTIERNGVKKQMVDMVFGKKSKNAGTHFFGPQTSQATFEEDKTWIGFDYICAVLNKNMRLIAGDIHIDNIDEATGLLNEEAWAADMADFTAGVAKLGDLEEDKEDLEAQQNAIVVNPIFGETDEQGVLIPDAQKLQDEAVRIAKLIKPIRAQIAAISAKYAERAAKRKAKADASKTKTPSEVAGTVAAAA